MTKREAQVGSLGRPCANPRCALTIALRHHFTRRRNRPFLAAFAVYGKLPSHHAVAGRRKGWRPGADDSVLMALRRMADGNVTTLVLHAGNLAVMPFS
jgi:hypothetical protein